MADPKPASEAFSRGFVRGQDTYVPGEERVDAPAVDTALARCPLCKHTWTCAPGGREHPDFNRRGERCPAVGSWLVPTGIRVVG